MNQKTRCLCGVCKHEWVTVFSSLYYGVGCPRCKSVSASKRMRRTEEQFKNIKELLLSRDIILELEYSDYIGNKQKCLFKCKKCGGEWLAILGCVIAESGCVFCARKKIKESKLRTEAEFDTDVKLIYLEKQIIVDINYSQYINGHTKIPCLCKKCGYRWLGRIDALKSGAGCQKCKGINSSSNSYKTLEQFNDIV